MLCRWSSETTNGPNLMYLIIIRSKCIEFLPLQDGQNYGNQIRKKVVLNQGGNQTGFWVRIKATWQVYHWNHHKTIRGKIDIDWDILVYTVRINAKFLYFSPECQSTVPTRKPFTFNSASVMPTFIFATNNKMVKSFCDKAAPLCKQSSVLLIWCTFMLIMLEKYPTEQFRTWIITFVLIKSILYHKEVKCHHPEWVDTLAYLTGCPLANKQCVCIGKLVHFLFPKAVVTAHSLMVGVLKQKTILSVRNTLACRCQRKSREKEIVSGFDAMAS